MNKRLAVLASGTGTLLEAILNNGISVELVVADRDCCALQIARQEKVPSVLQLHRTFGDYFDREEYTRMMLGILQNHEIDLVAMAGFMTIFSPLMFAPDAYEGRMTNTHPSLLPAFRGSRAVKDALEYGARLSGCTIHFATEKLDEGPILCQRVVPVRQHDTVETLHERIKAVERVVYPQIIRSLVEA